MSEKTDSRSSTKSVYGVTQIQKYLTNHNKARHSLILQLMADLHSFQKPIKSKCQNVTPSFIVSNAAHTQFEQEWRLPLRKSATFIVK